MSAFPDDGELSGDGHGWIPGPLDEWQRIGRRRRPNKGYPAIANRMNGYPKLVVSRTAEQADWPDTQIIRDPAGLAELKRRPGEDIALLVSWNGPPLRPRR